MKRIVDLQNVVGVAESQSIEWKPSLSQMSDIVETIAAFSNTEGGKLFIGVSDAGKLLGVNVGKATIENFTNRIVTSQKVEVNKLSYPELNSLKRGDFDGGVHLKREYSFRLRHDHSNIPRTTTPSFDMFSLCL